MKSVLNQPMQVKLIQISEHTILATNIRTVKVCVDYTPLGEASLLE